MNKLLDFLLNGRMDGREFIWQTFAIPLSVFIDIFCLSFIFSMINNVYKQDLQRAKIFSGDCEETEREDFLKKEKKRKSSFYLFIFILFLPWSIKTIVKLAALFDKLVPGDQAKLVLWGSLKPGEVSAVPGSNKKEREK